ncbi:unnamed protein product [Pleuronectes platessa]|uniref:Uncharacterized protein n=1 Tax=Pleuronectes platessa TaxID=8262 RepID=A0A9N7YGL2_PLEPL|nr:unnamed protein product [Pleuronectes platessa]
MDASGGSRTHAHSLTPCNAQGHPPLERSHPCTVGPRHVGSCACGSITPYTHQKQQPPPQSSLTALNTRRHCSLHPLPLSLFHLWSTCPFMSVLGTVGPGMGAAERRDVLFNLSRAHFWPTLSVRSPVCRPLALVHVRPLITLFLTPLVPLSRLVADFVRREGGEPSPFTPPRDRFLCTHPFLARCSPRIPRFLVHIGHVNRPSHSQPSSPRRPALVLLLRRPGTALFPGLMVTVPLLCKPASQARCSSSAHSTHPRPCPLASFVFCYLPPPFALPEAERAELGVFSGGSQMEKSDRPTYGEQPAHLRKGERERVKRTRGGEGERGRHWWLGQFERQHSPFYISHPDAPRTAGGRRQGGGAEEVGVYYHIGTERSQLFRLRTFTTKDYRESQEREENSALRPNFLDIVPHLIAKIPASLLPSLPCGSAALRARPAPLASSHLLRAHLLCGAIRERLERYLKLSSLIISRIPQDTVYDVTEDGRRRGRRERMKREMGCDTSVFSKGSGGNAQ